MAENEFIGFEVKIMRALCGNLNILWNSKNPNIQDSKSSRILKKLKLEDFLNIHYQTFESLLPIYKYRLRFADKARPMRTKGFNREVIFIKLCDRFGYELFEKYINQYNRYLESSGVSVTKSAIPKLNPRLSKLSKVTKNNRFNKAVNSIHSRENVHQSAVQSMLMTLFSLSEVVAYCYTQQENAFALKKYEKFIKGLAAKKSYLKKLKIGGKQYLETLEKVKRSEPFNRQLCLEIAIDCELRPTLFENSLDSIKPNYNGELVEVELKEYISKSIRLFSKTHKRNKTYREHIQPIIRDGKNRISSFPNKAFYRTEMYVPRER